MVLLEARLLKTIQFRETGVFLTTIRSSSRNLHR